ncbi:MAG TPA: phosphatase PAP2 family protein [Rhodospirillaceae bacterium]|nr:MAG: hypothetical protein A2018_03745 [Alphaproteobacteria bacterium GWF2_58_20]HAU29735.1 phosphatase PAP2 family protein [Rhodospirillaceae bacterium]
MSRRTFLIAGISLALLTLMAFPLDHAIAAACRNIPPVFLPTIRFITHLGESQYILVPALLLMLAFRKTRTAPTFIAARNTFTCVAATGIIIQIPKYLFGRARPKALWDRGLDGFHGITWDTSLTSFPSGHTATAVALALVLFHLFPKARIPLFLYAGFVALSRILLLQHYLSDVLGGAFIALLITIPLAKRLEVRV